MNKIVKFPAAPLFGVFILSLANTLPADDTDDVQSQKKDNAEHSINIPFPTMGGTQFWSDEFVHSEWRIQRNVLTGHFRLLDPKQIRHAWGSWDACLERWKEIQRVKELPAMKKKVILVLHGLGRTRKAMASMAEFLADDGEYDVLNISYASTRETVGEHAKSLARIVSNLENVEQINFVGHSMGNIVVRHYLADQLKSEHKSKIDSRIHRIVMIGPPNQGSQLARRFQENPAVRAVLGSSGQQLGKKWDELEKHLAVPPCQFGIIAGGTPESDGHSPLIDGNDDMVVSVEETRLEGAHDFLVVPGLHTLLMDDPTVQKATLRFLKHGHFISESDRNPISTPAKEM